MSNYISVELDGWLGWVILLFDKSVDLVFTFFVFFVAKERPIFVVFDVSFALLTSRAIEIHLCFNPKFINKHPGILIGYIQTLSCGRLFVSNGYFIAQIAKMWH